MRYRGYAIEDLAENVITSYSIHYTKLYEGPGLVVNRVVQKVGGKEHGDKILAVIAARIGDLNPANGDALQLVDLSLGRITSYNVCYTKLLREWTWARENVSREG